MDGQVFRRAGSRFFRAAGAIALFALSVAPAHALTFSGSGTGGLAATADFALSGSTLTVTLTNTGTNNISDRADVLTALFFTVAPSTITSYDSAVVAAGENRIDFTSGQGGATWTETTLANPLNVKYPGLDGGWEFVNGTGTGTVGLNVFNGLNVNATDYGLVGLGNVVSPNNGLANTGASPVIRNSVIFTFTVGSGFSLNNIGGVSFQYGTALTEPNIPGDCAPTDTNCTPDINVPEPGTLGLLGLGLLGVGLARRRRTA